MEVGDDIEGTIEIKTALNRVETHTMGVSYLLLALTSIRFIVL